MISLIALMLLNVSVMAQNTQPKREFRGAWIQAINGQFKGKSAADMQQMLTQQLNALQAAGINAIMPPRVSNTRITLLNVFTPFL